MPESEAGTRTVFIRLRAIDPARILPVTYGEVR